MLMYGINEITEDEEIRRGTIEATDIYEAARLFQGVTESNPESNYKIFELDDLSGKYLMVGSSNNDVMYYKALMWMLKGEGRI